MEFLIREEIHASQYDDRTIQDFWNVTGTILCKVRTMSPFWVSLLVVGRCLLIVDRYPPFSQGRYWRASGSHYRPNMAGRRKCRSNGHAYSSWHSRAASWYRHHSQALFYSPFGEISSVYIHHCWAAASATSRILSNEGASQLLFTPRTNSNTNTFIWQL